MTMTYTTYPTAVKFIAESVIMTRDIAKEYGNIELSVVEALNSTIEHLYERKRDARHRIGVFRFGMTSEQRYETDFLAMVARDVELGNVERPSVGNVRQAVLKEVEA